MAATRVSRVGMGQKMRSQYPNLRDGRVMSKSIRSFVIFMLVCKYTVFTEVGWM